MRRVALLRVLAVGVLVGSGCTSGGGEAKPSADSTAREGVATPTAATDPSTEVMNPAAVDCVPDDNGGAMTCGNLLAVRWDEDLPKLHQRLDSMRMRSANDRVERKADRACKANRKTLDVLLKAPIAMDSFPRAGTGTRDLVVGVFDVSRDEDCAEFKYGVKKNRGAGRKTIEFTVANTRSAVGRPTKDRPIGTWTSYALTWNEKGNGNGNGNGQKAYRLDKLQKGDFIQCGHWHPFKYGDVGFYSCNAMMAASTQAVKSADPETRFQSILAGAMKRDAASLALIGADPSTDPAWGRCGSLGCCSSGDPLVSTAMTGPAPKP